ncbi:MAG: isochorismatase family protein [Spirochaetes bacterium]|nr:isochorismatase family protein [Spirochaetota bacterium]
MLRDSLLMIIDMQEKLVTAMNQPDLQEAVANIQMLIAAYAKFNIPVIATEQYPSGVGSIIKKIKTADGFDKVSIMEKIHFDSLKESSINDAVKKLNRKKAVICGIESHICIYQTALSFLSEGYETYVVADAVASRNSNSRDYALDSLRTEGVKVLPAETILFMLIERAGCEDFKFIHRIIR